MARSGHGCVCYSYCYLKISQSKFPLHRGFLCPTGQQNCLKWAAAAAKLPQSCPTLCDPIDGSPPGSPFPGILQARTLEWAAVSFSYAWKWKVKVKLLSRVWLLVTPWTVARQAPPSTGFFQARVLEWGAIAFSMREICLRVKMA